jgi:hypothetical protein
LLTEPKLIRRIAAFVASCDLASAALGAVRRAVRGPGLLRSRAALSTAGLDRVLFILVFLRLCGDAVPRQPCKLSSLPWWGFKRSNWPNPAQALGRFYYGYYGRFLIERAFVAVNLMIETDQ